MLIEAEEPAAPSKVRQSILREQLAENGALDAEIEILLNQRVELNALTSGDLVAMIPTDEAFALLEAMGMPFARDNRTTVAE